MLTSTESATRAFKCVVATRPRFLSSIPPTPSIVTAQLRLKQKHKPLLWQTEGIIKGKKAPSQLLFQEALQRLFPNEEILFNARKVINIKSPDSDVGYLEVDVYFPRLKFPLEFQDPYHYSPAVYYSSRPLAIIQQIDDFKKRALGERGEPLLQIPCWWDGTDDTLAATIKAFRPDLLQHLNPDCSPVSDSKPDNFFVCDVVPDVGVPMRPVFYSKKLHLSDRKWLVAEKYDGVRCIWNPKEKSLYSRFGKQLRFPEELGRLMPDHYLDCEAWFGCGHFQEATKLSTRYIIEVDWPAFRLVVFDLVNPESKQLPYIDRYKKLHSIVEPDHPFMILSPQALLESEEQQREFENLVGKHGGEGLVIREQSSPYEDGYTFNVLKIKPTIDQEALVVSSDSKSLTVELVDETRFSMLVHEKMQRPKIGDVITITYKRYVHGSTLPHKPEILRIRSDVTWDEVVANSNRSHPGKRGLGSDFSWRWDINLDDIRGHFTKYAHKHKFDPLVPDNWYAQIGGDIKAEKGARNMLKAFNGSFIDAVMAAFPELRWDRSRFLRLPRHYWKEMENVKTFFENFAKEKGFDPLVPHNWYNIKQSDIMAVKGGGVLNRFKSSLTGALFAAFPRIGLDKAKFSKVPKNYWRDMANVRIFFENLAKNKGFDPLVPNNWYSVRISDIVAAKGGWGVLNCFRESVASAIMAAFPTIGLDKSKFSIRTIGKTRFGT